MTEHADVPDPVDLIDPASRHYVFRLYLVGSTPQSMRAASNLRSICEEHLQGRYEIEIVDLEQEPGRAADGQVLAAPTLVKHLPLPLRRFIGDLSQRERILLGLEIPPIARTGTDGEA